MTMRRNEFQEIANILKPYIISDHSSVESRIVSEIANNLCFFFKRNNPAFNKEKFLKACGIYNV